MTNGNSGDGAGGKGGGPKALMSTEEKNVGSVPMRIYVKYLQAAGGMCMFAFAYFLFVLATGNNVLATQWVRLVS